MEVAIAEFVDEYGDSYDDEKNAGRLEGHDHLGVGDGWAESYQRKIEALQMKLPIIGTLPSRDSKSL